MDRKVKLYINRLAQVADSAPRPIRREVKRAVHGIRVRYGFTDREKQNLIIESVRNGAQTVRDVHDDTGLHIQTLKVLLPAMVREGILKVEKRTAWTKVGRPTNHYTLGEQTS